MTTALPPDPWKALGVERDADKAEIRAAYKKLVLKCHPDKVQDPALKQQKADEFQKVQQAYELLNDDAEKAKYEQKLKLAELRAAKIEQDIKTSPNISVPRSSAAKYAAAYDIRTSEPTSRYKSAPTSGKVYTHYTSTHTRSHEEMPSSRTYPVYEESDKQARRAASYEKYEKPSKRDDERRERDREERRRRREEEELTRLRDREREKDREREREREKERDREKEREARKAEKKRQEKLDKEREKERRREADEKNARRHKPYVEEPYAADYMAEMMFEDEKYVTSASRSEKKRSSSRKKGEGRDRERDRDREREREKSTSRRTRSPHVSSDRKHMDLYEHAASYMANSGSLPSSAGAFWTSQQTPPDSSFHKPLAPTPPPADHDEENIRRSSARAAGRRSSNDAARSRDQLRYEAIEVTSRAKPIPTLKQSYSTPPAVPESPPRITRSQTTHEPYARPIPSLSRNQTWAPGGIAEDRHATAEYNYEYESDDDRERERRRHRSRRTRSPSAQPTHRYKVEGGKTSKLEAQYTYSAGESPTSTRRYMSSTDMLDGHVSHSPSSTTYVGSGFRVKETKKYGLGDVKYSEYGQPTYYTTHGDSYGVMA
ncbi:hypothetical protein VTI74DRAFT_5474 [Chaetomium olivicolor]